jgi:hypothetical protein
MDLRLLKLFYLIAGSLSVLSGMALFWLPLPFGIPLILLGTGLFMRSSPEVRKRIEEYIKGRKYLHFVTRFIQVRSLSGTKEDDDKR